MNLGTLATVKDTEICGAKEKDGKLSDNFSFDTGLTDAGIVKCGEYFAVVAVDRAFDTARPGKRLFGAQEHRADRQQVFSNFLLHLT